VPTGYSTCPGEGSHREVKEAYAQTNFKNTDSQINYYAVVLVLLIVGPQLARIDGNKEAFARIGMGVDEYENGGRQSKMEETMKNLRGRALISSGSWVHLFPGRRRKRPNRIFTMPTSPLICILSSTSLWSMRRCSPVK